VYRHTRSITLLNVCAEYIPCEGLERVKFLKLSILHRHCLGTALTKVTVVAVVHHVRQPSDRLLLSGEECQGGCSKIKMLAQKHHLSPLFIWRGQSGAAIIGWLRLPL
jgi:hypothetical protein